VVRSWFRPILCEAPERLLPAIEHESGHERIDVTEVARRQHNSFLVQASVGGALALLEEKNTASASPENVLQEVVHSLVSSPLGYAVSFSGRVNSSNKKMTDR